MGSRENILNAVRAARPDGIALPQIPGFAQQENLLDRFVTTLTGIGGSCVMADDLQPLIDYCNGIQKNMRVVNAVEGLPGYGLNGLAEATAPELESVQVFFMRGSMAIAENGAIWVPEKNMVNRLLPFLCEHLVIVIEEKDMVGTMHQAYERIKIDEEGYGVFIAGPSKTADIEQSLVIGAHGPLGLQVFIIRDKN
jgi:L-lactate dehydrogenase complex protein LldG